MLQAFVILILGLVMGAFVSLEPLGWLGGLVLICGFGLGSAGIGLAVASRASNTGMLLIDYCI